MKVYTVTLLKSQCQIQCDNRISLLRALELQGFTPEYQCRDGYCGACRIKIKRGKVFYRFPPLALLQPDEILLCCCQLDQNIEIDL